MSQTLQLNSQETLEELKNAIVLDDQGMFSMLGKAIIVTPQETIGRMMRSAADLGGINLAKVIMRKAGYDMAFSMSKLLISSLKLSGPDLVKFYAETAGKRGWGFNVIETIDGAGGAFRCTLHKSPFVLGFTEKMTTTVCDFQAGSLEAMLHAAGLKDMQIVETQCVAKGDKACVFENKKE
jgi:predicted hydrocarbon binding protein